MCILRQFKSVGYGKIRRRVHKDCVHWVMSDISLILFSF